jgi:Integrase core domain
LRGPSTSRGAVADEERPHTTLGHASACLSPAYLTIPGLERIGAHPADHPKGNDWSGRFPLVVEAEPPSLEGPWSALERASGILWGYQRSATLDFSRPGKPTDKAFIESFNGKFRGESLIAHWFMSLDERAENARLGVETTTRKRLTARSAKKLRSSSSIDQWRTVRPERNRLKKIQAAGPRS